MDHSIAGGNKEITDMLVVAQAEKKRKEAEASIP